MKLFASGNIPALPSGLSIAVYEHDGTDTPSALATITDHAGSAIAQPGFVTDAAGWFEFSGADALYDIKLGGGAGAPDTSWNGGAAKWIRGQALVSPGGAGGYKNKIINGCFRHWQRGTSHSTPGYGSADRWRTVGGGSSITLSKQDFTVGQSDVPGNPLSFSRSVVSSVAGASNSARVYQKVEGVETLSDGKATISFWAKADASKNIAIGLNQNFGSGGSAGVSAIGAQQVALTTSWQKFELTVAIPSISGKTVGTDSSLWLTFWFDAGTDYDARTASLGQQSGTFDIAQVQLEEGSVATDFEQRSIGQELALCQRYYWESTSFVFATNYRTDKSMCQVSHPVTMRDLPTLNYTHAGLVSPSTDTFLDGFYVTSASSVGGSSTYLSWYGVDAEL